MKSPAAQPMTFADSLEKWLVSHRRKNLLGLAQVFQEKAFAVLFLLLMALPALPLPTGGVTHVTELITMLLALELVAGRHSLWLPRRWQNVNVNNFIKGSAVRRLIRFISWFERRSRQRLPWLVNSQVSLTLIGLLVFIFTLAAFAAPPFSGLDTLPSLGVVLIALAMILEDGLLMLIGALIGVIGVGLEITAGTALYKSLTHFF